MIIPVYDNKVDEALAKLRKALKAENLLGDMKKHEHYRKPNVKKREKRNAAIARRIAADRDARRRARRVTKDS